MLRTYNIVIVLFMMFVITKFSDAEDRTFSPSLWKVEKIYVGDMGQSDEAARFRLLLEEELAKKMFIPVSSLEQADAVITGVLAVRIYSNKSIARATVQLKARSGERLWGGDFQPRSAAFKRVSDTVKFRAENIAGDLRKDWNKAAKTAGQPEKK